MNVGDDRLQQEPATRRGDRNLYALNDPEEVL